MNRDKKELPEFKNEMEERTFRKEHDSTDYLDWDESRARVHLLGMKIYRLD